MNGYRSALLLVAILAVLIGCTTVPIEAHSHSHASGGHTHSSHAHAHSHAHSHDAAHDHHHEGGAPKNQNAFSESFVAATLCGVVPVLFMQVLPGAPSTRMLMIMQGFAAGGLLGDVFLHVIPHMSPTEEMWRSVLVGIFVFMSFDAVLGLISDSEGGHGHSHSHREPKKGKDASKNKSGPISAAAVMSLCGDALHNFMDGVALFSSFSVSYPVGVCTTIAIMAHEFPHELGDFAVLMSHGFSHLKASVYQIMTAVASLSGVVAAHWFSNASEVAQQHMLPFVAGTMLYLALCTLLSEVNAQSDNVKTRFLAVFAFGVGVVSMHGVTMIEELMGVHTH